MNVRQFISSTLFWLTDRGSSGSRVIRYALSLPIRVIFPKMGYERIDRGQINWRTFAAVYVMVVFFCFATQAALSHVDGVFVCLNEGQFCNSGTERIEFTEDWWNLANYLVIVPLYAVTGVGFLISLFSLESRYLELEAEGFTKVENTSKPLLSGVLAFSLLVLILLLSQASYAHSVREEATRFFWFHGETIAGPFEFRGYYYLMVNAVLATFVASVAILHLELFRWASQLTLFIRKERSLAIDELRSSFWADDNKIKRFFSPFTETSIWSKSFAVMLAINLYTWKESGVSSDPDTDTNALYLNLVFVIYVVVAVWLVSLPRYRVQYEIFKLRNRLEQYDYKDIRMPWILGWSALVDFVLLAFLSNAIFRDRIDDFIANLFT